MKSNVRIQVDTAIERGNGQSENMNVEAMGQFYNKGNSVYIHYEETLDQAGSVSNLVKINEDEITVIRQGAITMRQVFKPEMTTEAVYQSPYGSMIMNTLTKQADFGWQTDKNRGMITLAYIVIMQGEQIGDYRVTMKIEEV